jgi:hypothetical protein
MNSFPVFREQVRAEFHFLTPCASFLSFLRKQRKLRVSGETAGSAFAGMAEKNCNNQLL